MACRQSTPQTLRQAACQAIVNLCGSVDGALAVLKSSFVADAVKAIRTASIRADARNMAHLAAVVPVLQALAAAASHSEGQRHLVRIDVQPSLLESLVELLEATSHPEASAAALMVLRNVALRHDNKSYFLADPKCALVTSHTTRRCCCCFAMQQSSLR